MKSIDRRSIGLAIAIFALVGGMVTLAPATAEATHPQKKGAVESRSFRDFVRRLDRAGHDQCFSLRPPVAFSCDFIESRERYRRTQ